MIWKSQLKDLLGRMLGLKDIDRRFFALEMRLFDLQAAIGRVEARQTVQDVSAALYQVEFKVFSQFGEDGIIQHLVRHIPIPHQVFVEFGVEAYAESNTRFLLENNNWTGLILDGNAGAIKSVQQSQLYWRFDLTAVQAFITRENINELIASNGVSGDIGLLSVDIDGNDYWVWQAIDVISPRIVIVEYNARFGAGRKVTIPYDPAFAREKAHYSHIYYGASLSALVELARAKGYDFIGCNTGGNDAFFVRRDIRPEGMPVLRPEEGFRDTKARESRDAAGKLNHLSREQELEILQKLPVVEV